MSASFNLVTEPWIQMANGSLYSLSDLFKDNQGVSSLGGTPLEMLSVFKLLLAVSQAACVVSDEDYVMLDVEEFSSRVLAYLDQHREKFDLYHDVHPFLQMPVKQATTAHYNALMPFKIDPDTNTTVTSHLQVGEKNESITDAMLARLLLTQMNFAFAGKKVDKNFSLNGLPQVKSAPIAVSLSFGGALHSYLSTSNIVETLLINLYTTDAFDPQGSVDGSVNLTNIFPSGLGVAPWEEMPESETCPVAERLKDTYMGRLVGLARFCLIDRETKSFHYSMGIQHLGYSDGKIDPTFTINTTQKKPRILWADPDKSSWYSFESIFSFLSNEKDAWDSMQVRNGLKHTNDLLIDDAKLISTGVKVKTTIGETKVGGRDDFVYSEVNIHPGKIGSFWFERVKEIWNEIDFCNKALGYSVGRYAQDAGCIALKDGMNRKVSSLFLKTIESTVRQSILDVNNDADQHDLSAVKNFETLVQKAAREAYEVIQPTGTRRVKAFVLNKPRFIKNPKKGAAKK